MINRWLIALACAWTNLFIFAPFRSAGVIYLAIIDEYHCSYQQAAWPVSLAGSIASLMGLVAGFMTHYAKMKYIVMVGVVVTASAFITSHWSHSIEFITVTVGVVQGVGIGLVTNLLPAILNHHFPETKTMALGISYAGATLGAFVFPVMIKFLLEHYHFHNTMLLMGGECVFSFESFFQIL